MEKNKKENKLSAFFTFTRYQIQSQIQRNRWLFPIVLGLLIGLRNATILQGDPALHIMKPANVWDVIFSTLGSTYFVHLVILTTFLYLIGDLLPEKSYGQLILFRLKSRRQWWLSKILTLLTLTVVYMFLFVAPVVLVGGLTHGWSLDYSEQTFLNRFMSGVPANLFATATEAAYITPPDLFAQTLLLIFLALFTCGLFATVITLFTSRSLFGLIGGFSFVFVSLIGNSLSGPPSRVKFLPSHHVAYLGSLPVRTIPVPISVLYWMIWICLLISLGFFRSLKQNIFSVAKE
ncbi:MAG: hypothetical protein QM231_03800 [Chloroflexota bacterium]|mgnify:FL=1|nr:hypothetical protein [Chloroflexota bacterium]